MIIFDNALYLHIPKTGGTSFEQMMEERHKIKVFGDQHNTAVDIPMSDLHKKVFGFMRDPLIAEISNWRYHYFCWSAMEMTFEKWCEWRFGDEDEDYGYSMGLQPHQVKHGYKFNVRPSAGYFCNALGQCVADRIYRYEEIEDAMEEISDMLGMDCSIDGFRGMQFAWSRGKEKYSQYITPRVEKLVRKAKAIDFKLHGAQGRIPTNYTCRSVRDYGYAR